MGNTVESSSDQKSNDPNTANNKLQQCGTSDIVYVIDYIASKQLVSLINDYKDMIMEYIKHDKINGTKLSIAKYEKNPSKFDITICNK